MAQSYLRNPSVERLPVILEELHRGSLCIPPFQRDFEWDGRQRLALCSSVRMGLPTGALMVWRTSHALKSEDPIGPYSLPQPRTPASQYLLDGRQRMTTLYAALAPSFWTSDGLTPPELTGSNRNAPDGTPWSIMFDLDSNGDDPSNFVYEEIPSQGTFLFDKRPLLPLSVLLDDNAYDEWRGRNKLSREQTNRARALRSAFTDYLIPVVPLVTDDISVVTLTFKRVNSGGTPMGDADMTRVLAWSKGFDLRDHINRVREELNPHGWGSLEEDALHKVIAVVSKLEPTEVNPEELAKKIQVTPSLVETAGERVLGAVQLLGDGLGIAGPGALPYEQVLVFVARALDHAGGALTPEQHKKLTGWAAEVCLDARFGGAPTHMIRADWRALANRLGLPDADPPRARDEKRPKVSECWVFSMAWARSRGTALVLAAQGPRDAGDKPFANPGVMVARGTDNLGMLLADGAEGLPASLRKRVATNRLLKVALRSPANRVVCPSEALPSLRAALLRPDCPEGIRRSHLISANAHAALLASELEDFFELRRDAIIAAEERWVQERGGKVDILREPRTYAAG
ncbi:DUF262 domain-containing protein [Sorangium sp. So ce269]